jgi:hypothetical protein
MEETLKRRSSRERKTRIVQFWHTGLQCKVPNGKMLRTNVIEQWHSAGEHQEIPGANDLHHKPKECTRENCGAES